MKVKMKKRKILCSNCKTGQESCIIDPGSPACPYVSCYDGFKCAYYVPVKNEKGKEIFRKLLNKIKKI